MKTTPMKLATLLATLLVAAPLAGAAEEAKEPCGGDYSSIEMTDLVARVAKRDGRQFIVDPRVRAQVPLVGLDLNKIDYDRLLAILRVHQFMAVPEREVVTIIPDAGARQQVVPTVTDLNFKARDDEFVTLILAGKNACAAHAVPILRPMMPQNAHLAADAQSNSLIILDRVANVRRIGELFQRLDRGAPAGQKCDPVVVTAK